MPHNLQWHFYTAKIPLAGYNVLPALLPADWNVVCGGQYCDIAVLIVMLRMPWQSSSYDEKKPLPRDTKYFLLLTIYIFIVYIIYYVSSESCLNHYLVHYRAV